MRCRICSEDKLRKEFAHVPLSAECQHPPLYCLRCAVAGARKNRRCPYQNCAVLVENDRVEEYKLILDKLFPVISVQAAEVEQGDDVIYVATLEGERTAIPLTQHMFVLKLKEVIADELQVEINKQKLMYGDREIEVYTEDGDMNTLQSYDIRKGYTIHLMVLLYAIPDYMDNVIFDLSWGYPTTGRDFLDATCFIYSLSTYLGTVNYDSKSWPSFTPCIEHSGDGMDDSHRRGYHTINVSLKKVPDTVTHLLFALSVFSNPSIAHFPSPILRFYDAANKGKDLCNTSVAEASDSEAVIMCYVTRKTNKKGWDIHESGQLSAGNVMNYDPLKETAIAIIAGRYRAKTRRGRVIRAAAAPISALPTGGSSGPREVQIVFCFDTTGSMHRCIREVRKRVTEIITRLLRDMPNIQIAVFAHGDYDCPDPYVTKFMDFSNNKNLLRDFVNNVEGTGGGGAECYEFALYEIRTRLSWRPGTNKSVVMIGDSTPHEPEDPINELNVDWRNEATRLFKDKGVRIYSCHCETRWKSHSFWKKLAELGHGKYLQLHNFNEIVNLLLAICYREGAPSLLRKFQEEMRSQGALGGTMSSLFQ